MSMTGLLRQSVASHDSNDRTARMNFKEKACDDFVPAPMQGLLYAVRLLANLMHDQHHMFCTPMSSTEQATKSFGLYYVGVTKVAINAAVGLGVT